MPRLGQADRRDQTNGAGPDDDDGIPICHCTSCYAPVIARSSQATHFRSHAFRTMPLPVARDVCQSGCGANARRMTISAAQGNCQNRGASSCCTGGIHGGPHSRYHDEYERWRRDPEAFWAEAARDIDWYEPPKRMFDPDAGVYGRWFPDAVCNTCWNAVDRHVMRGRGAQPAIIYDSPLAGEKRILDLRSAAHRGAGAGGAAARLRGRRRATASSSTCRWCRRR